MFYVNMPMTPNCLFPIDISLTGQFPNFTVGLNLTTWSLFLETKEIVFKRPRPVIFNFPPALCGIEQVNTIRIFGAITYCK